MGLSHIDQQAARIAELEAQVAALQEIAIGEGAYILSVNVIESTGVDEFHRKTAKDLLSEEHPEAFRWEELEERFLVGDNHDGKNRFVGTIWKGVRWDTEQIFKGNDRKFSSVGFL
jgi:hypothetical protein